MSVQDSHRQYIRLWDYQASLYEYYARQAGLQGKGLTLLLWLYHSPEGLTQQQLASKTHSTKQVVHATIKSWQAKGYVDMGPAPRDKRQKFVRLTPAGRAFAQPLVTRLDAIEGAAMAQFSPEEQAQFVALSGRYVAALAQAMKEEHHDSISTSE